ncbi:prepilin-type N-terminal cleavage/methylation domain-containing protein [Microcoleus sp. B7-D4]|uniref:prepilin-type N-terminal cleavage/methylation domain-containing protein n=1 Tax=Microcoleus sp. B7-D4 TaxID=2818696 RepID=UPI002FCFEE76
MKTPPILLKLLHNSAAKPSPNFNKTASRKDDAGFTLLEVIVIALIVGILSSIAAPSWVAFINRQRVRTVNDRVFQSLRLAQSEAKRTKSSVTVTFSAPSVDPPTVTFTPPLATGGSTQQLNAGGEIKKGQVKISPASCPVGASCRAATPLTFNYNGLVDPDNSTNPKLPLVVTVAPAGGGTKQCVIVETLLGGMRTAEGNSCTTVPSF